MAARVGEVRGLFGTAEGLIGAGAASFGRAPDAACGPASCRDEVRGSYTLRFLALAGLLEESGEAAAMERDLYYDESCSLPSGGDVGVDWSCRICELRLCRRDGRSVAPVSF